MLFLPPQQPSPFACIGALFGALIMGISLLPITPSIAAAPKQTSSAAQHTLKKTKAPTVHGDKVPVQQAMREIDALRRHLWKRNTPDFEQFRARLAQNGFSVSQDNMWPGWRVLNRLGDVQSSWQPAYDHFQQKHEAILIAYTDQILNESMTQRVVSVPKAQITYYQQGIERFEQLEQSMLPLMNQQQELLVTVADRYRRIDQGGLSNQQISQCESDIQQTMARVMQLTQQIVQITQQNAFESKAPSTCSFKPRTNLESMRQQMQSQTQQLLQHLPQVH